MSIESEMKQRVDELVEGLMEIDPVRWPTREAALKYLRESLTGGDPVANVIKERENQ